jgi:hypothetical protein
MASSTLCISSREIVPIQLNSRDLLTVASWSAIALLFLPSKTIKASLGQRLESQGIRVSIYGRGNLLFVERYWRTLKHEEVYLKAYQEAKEAKVQIGCYLRFFNRENASVSGV